MTAGSSPVVDLDQRVGSYLALRRSLGHQLLAPERMLTNFTSWLRASEYGHLTVDAAVAWASGLDSRGKPFSRAQVSVRLSTVRSFATYLNAFDPDTEIPPKHLLRPEVQRRVPYLFGPGEITALMSQAAQLNPPLWSRSIVTLIGLMAATGLRTGEAFRLDHDDVDLHAGTLLVRHSKHGRSRLLPLHPSTTAALRDYLADRARLCPHPGSPSLLLTQDGGRLNERRPVSETFRRLLDQAEISAGPGRRPPRLHDLRHVFAVNTLRDWHQLGGPVQPKLALLADYLGHVNPSHTYWYLQAVPDLMGALVERLETYLRDSTSELNGQVQS